MNTLLSEEQAALEDQCLKLLRNEWPLEKAIKVLGPRGPRHSPELWKTLVDAGWLGFPFSSELGGADGELTDLGVIYRAAGECVVPSTYYSCMFGGLLVDALATAAQKQELLAPMIAGEHLITSAYAEPHAAELPGLFTAAATRVGESWVLNGTKSFVADLGSADIVLVLARIHQISDSAGWGLFAIRKDELRERVRQTDAFGATPLWEIQLEKLKLPLDALVGGLEAASNTREVFEDVVQKATALQCMEMAGGIAGILRFTVDYVKERQQFGKPIGTKQAVQHLLANISMSLDGVRVAALKALFLAAQRRKEAGRAVSLAKVALGEAYVNATITCGQLWGAMGYSRETGLYLWVERAKVTDVWLGTRSSHLKKLANYMELAR
ncbi:MAG: acyl-CoA dehydrogenase family protein [Steroidobacteraceae bacterium]